MDLHELSLYFCASNQPRTMEKVLFICLGNICRSPMAHGIFRAKAEQHGLDFEVESAGTSSFHNGQTSDPRAIETLRSKGIDIMDLRSRLFVDTDFDEYDHIFTMDSQNQRDVMKMAENLNHKNLPKMIMEEAFPGEHISVPDPYYGGASGFEDVYQMLDKAIDKLILRLL